MVQWGVSDEVHHAPQAYSTSSLRLAMMKQILYFTITVLVCGVSTQQIPNQTAVAGVSTNINIPCNLGRQEQAPFWFINNTAYELFSIPFDFPYVPVVSSYTQLTIPVVTLELNDTVFQCASFDPDDGRLVLGIPNKLLVSPNPNSPNDSSLMRPLAVLSLQINYQEFDIEQNTTTVGWIFDPSDENCNKIFVLQGYTLPSLVTGILNLPTPAFNYTIRDSTIGQISSDHLTSSTGEPIVYRILSVDENDTICSDMASQNHFYRFDESDRLDTRVLAPNSTACYDIPMLDTCTPIFVWPRMPGSDLSCACHLANNSGGRSTFQICSCLTLNSTSIIPRFSQNGSICLVDSNSELNEIVVHFQCSADPCGIGDCFLNTILTIHKIIISGPPSTPVITFNSSNGALCFSAYSHVEFPVLNFTVEVTDATGIPSDLSDTYITGSPLCLTVTSDPTRTPNVCSPFTVSATVWNAIGKNSSSPMEFPLTSTNEDEAIEFRRSCSCYQEREQTNISISRITANSAEFNLTCGLNQTDSIDYILVGDPSRQIELFCGSSQNRTGLTPNTDYVLQRLYSDEIRCSVSGGNFTTGSSVPASNTLSGEIIAAIIIASVVIIIIIIIAIIIIIHKKCKNGNSYNLSPSKFNGKIEQDKDESKDEGKDESEQREQESEHNM